MLDVYAATVDLYSYIWSPTLYESKSAEERIPDLLSRMATDFHTVQKIAGEKISGELMKEPGFEITLNVQRELLSEMRHRYAAGDRDYVRWRLQGMLANCASCHSRYQVKNDFIGDIPISNEDTLAARFSKAQFLLATRQFESAGREFYKLAETLNDLPSSQRYAFNALKGWLVVEVRVKNRPKDSAADLEKFINKTELADVYSVALLSWKRDLEKFAAENTPKAPKPAQTIKKAKTLLSFIHKGIAEQEDDKNLIKTLRATALLHALLEQQVSPAERSQALLELARAYLHIPISLFEPFREMYLEQCIREFPHSAEAREAFTLYKDYEEFVSSGSSGTHLDPEQQQRMEELRKLALGR